MANIVFSPGTLGADTKIAAGQAVSVGASDTIVTGLRRVLFAVASFEDAPVLGVDTVCAVVGDQAGTPAAGSILIKGFKTTGTGDTTPVAATTFSKKINWLAVGY